MKLPKKIGSCQIIIKEWILKNIILGKCKTEEIERVEAELVEYEQRQMYKLTKIYDIFSRFYA